MVAALVLIMWWTPECPRIDLWSQKYSTYARTRHTNIIIHADTKKTLTHTSYTISWNECLSLILQTRPSLVSLFLFPGSVIAVVVCTIWSQVKKFYLLAGSYIHYKRRICHIFGERNILILAALHNAETETFVWQ